MPENEVLTADKVLEMFRETDRKFQETDLKFQETDRKFQETDRKYQEVFGELKEQGRRLDEVIVEQKEQGRKLDETIVKHGRILKSLNTQMGRLTNKVGKFIEKATVPGVVEKFNEKGFHFDSIDTNVKFPSKKENENLAEVDVLMENGKSVILMEIKADLKTSDVTEHESRIALLRKNPRFKGKEIYGALSTAVMRQKAAEYAMKKGFYVLRQPDALRVSILNFPAGFKAKSW